MQINATDTIFIALYVTSHMTLHHSAKKQSTYTFLGCDFHLLNVSLYCYPHTLHTYLISCERYIEKYNKSKVPRDQFQTGRKVCYGTFQLMKKTARMYFSKKTQENFENKIWFSNTKMIPMKTVFCMSL